MDDDRRRVEIARNGKELGAHGGQVVRGVLGRLALVEGIGGVKVIGAEKAGLLL